MKEKINNVCCTDSTDWSGWQSKAALDHQISTVLAMTSPTDRLRWLVELLEGLEKLGLIANRTNDYD